MYICIYIYVYILVLTYFYFIFLYIFCIHRIHQLQVWASNLGRGLRRRHQGCRWRGARSRCRKARHSLYIHIYQI